MSRRGGEGGAAALGRRQAPGGLDRVGGRPRRPDAYPIVTFTWMLFYGRQDPVKAEVLRKLVAYGLTDGQKIADSMGYVPFPAKCRRSGARRLGQNPVSGSGFAPGPEQSHDGIDACN